MLSIMMTNLARRLLWEEVWPVVPGQNCRWPDHHHDQEYDHDYDYHDDDDYDYDDDYDDDDDDDSLT